MQCDQNFHILSKIVLAGSLGKFVCFKHFVGKTINFPHKSHEQRSPKMKIYSLFNLWLKSISNRTYRNVINSSTRKIVRNRKTDRKIHFMVMPGNDETR